MNVVTKQKITVETTRWDGVLRDVGEASLPRLNAHHPGWISAITKGLRHSTYVLKATLGDQVVGTLPLCLVSGPIFGRFLVSLPYVNTGGVWARDRSAAEALISAGCELADELDVKYLELRHEHPVPHPRLNFERTDKVHMRLPLPSTADELMSSLKSKVRSQVKKSMKFELSAEFGQHNLLNDFYHVFSANMRDLGTPVLSKQLFANILDHLGEHAELCVVRSGSKTAAAGLLVHLNNLTEIPSASCLRAFNRMNANMFMYWRMLERSIERGSHLFDFGRTSIDSGTHRFKAQWGAQAAPADWQYYVRKGNPEDMRADSEGKQKLVKIWQQLPVWLTKLVGPTIVRGIP